MNLTGCSEDCPINHDKCEGQCNKPSSQDDIIDICNLWGDLLAEAKLDAEFWKEKYFELVDQQENTHSLLWKLMLKKYGSGLKNDL